MYSDWKSGKSDFRLFHKDKYPAYPLNVLVFLEAIEVPKSDIQVSDACIAAFESVVRRRYEGCPKEERNLKLFQSVFRDGNTFTRTGKLYGVTTEAVRLYIRSFLRSLSYALRMASSYENTGVLSALVKELNSMGVNLVTSTHKWYTISNDFEYLGYNVPYATRSKGIKVPYAHCKHFEYPINLLAHLGILPAEGRYSPLLPSTVADFETVLLKYLGATSEARSRNVAILKLYYRDGLSIDDIEIRLGVSGVSRYKSDALHLLSELCMRKARAGITDPEARQLMLFYKPKKGVD